MQAILTRYIGSTNCRGSRIRASCERGSISISYPSELTGEACHRAAVDALVAKFVKEDAAKYGTGKNPWSRGYVTGGLPGNMGCAHVYTEGGL